MNKMRYLIVVVTLLVGCAAPDPVGIETIAALGDCTPGTGGWGGEGPKCRATLTDGTKCTIRRPVDVGDTVRVYRSFCTIPRD